MADNVTEADAYAVRLDERQRGAVEAPERFVLVSAPPGSGKTAVLAARFSRLLSLGVDPGRVLALTFTCRAADEMRRRLGRSAGMDARGLNVHTFHSYCLGVLGAARPDLRIAGRHEATLLLKSLGARDPEGAADRISAYKNGGPMRRGREADALFLDLYARYNNALQGSGSLDLDDVIDAASEEIEAGRAAPPEHVLIDEFQDINALQSRLLSLLSRTSSLFAIGDPDQSIYAFRGSSPDYFNGFTASYPGAGVYTLAMNYRSGLVIARASDGLMRGRAGRVGRPVEAAAEGGRITFVRCGDEAAEAAFIIREIEAAMGGLTSLDVSHDGGGLRFSDFAVLFRTNASATRMARAFERSALPFHLAKRPGADLKDFIAALRGSHGRLANAPDAGLADFATGAAGALRLDEEAARLVEKTATGLGGRASENLKRLADELALLDELDTVDVKADKVNLMTIHSSKGLEFRTVFIAGFEDGLLPLRGEDDKEEERRLLFVAMTRAAGDLYLTAAGKRTVNGKAVERAHSPFLDDLPADVIERVEVGEKKRVRGPVQKGLFE